MHLYEALQNRIIPQLLQKVLEERPSETRHCPEDKMLVLCWNYEYGLCDFMHLQIDYLWV